MDIDKLIQQAEEIRRGLTQLSIETGVRKPMLTRLMNEHVKSLELEREIANKKKLAYQSRE